jgi:hypothetical protein
MEVRAAIRGECSTTKQMFSPSWMIMNRDHRADDPNKQMFLLSWIKMDQCDHRADVPTKQTFSPSWMITNRDHHAEVP